jgi:hypothetical protein
MNPKILKALELNQADLDKKKSGMQKVLDSINNWNQKPLSNRRPILPDEQVENSIFNYDTEVLNEEIS